MLGKFENEANKDIFFGMETDLHVPKTEHMNKFLYGVYVKEFLQQPMDLRLKLEIMEWNYLLTKFYYLNNN